MSAERCDVLILGGGLAGLSTALALTTTTRLAVALVEMRPAANRSVRAVYNDAIHKFGLEDAVLQSYTAMAFHSAYGTSVRFEYGEKDSLSALDYACACQILRQRAVDSGLLLRPGRAVHLDVSERGVLLSLAGGMELETELLVDASGAAQWTARQMGVRGSRYVSRCYGQRLAGCAVEEPQTFAFLAPHHHFGNGGGWLYPVGNGVLSAGYSLVTPAQQAPRDTAWRWAAARTEFPLLARQVAGSAQVSIEGGAIPVGRVERFCDDRILRVGDAAGQANPWSVEGCRPALENGVLAAQVIDFAFRSNDFQRTVLDWYEIAWKKDNRERFWRTASVAEVHWGRSDADWERFLRRYGQIPSARQYLDLRDNRTNFFGQMYSWLGFARRESLKWLRQRSNQQ